MTSIIIPTLNEAGKILITLRTVLAQKGSFEVIVVDAGSQDETLQVVSQFPTVRIFSVQTAERAYQMNIGATQALGDYLLFLHADTLPCEDCLQLLEKQFSDPEVVGGSFRLQFDQHQWHYRFLAKFTHINSRFWTFGDQGIFVRKSIFQQLGGYASMPILEDLELQLRIRKHGKFVKIPRSLITSARRFQRNGLWRGLLVNVVVLIGYFLGVSPRRLSWWYQQKNKYSAIQRL